MYHRIREPLHLFSRTRLRITRFDCPIRPFTSSSPDFNSSPWKIAIVGSGPSGCYTAKYLKSSLKDSHQIDVLDRLPTPYGLVRNGVAPDHPEVKNVENDFDSLFEANDGSDPTVNFYGNVNVGTDISLKELREIYDIVVLAYGCESDKPFDFIQNSKLEGILSAREFVSWYNGHVDYEWVGSIVEQALKRHSDGIQQVVVIGHGNVALDCARILAKTRTELDPTDIASRSLDVINQGNDDKDNTNAKREISVIGRRGHVQGAFTIKELRELTRLDDANFVVREDELDMGRTEASEQEIKDARPRKRMDKLLTDAAASAADNNPEKNADVHLRFLLNPVSFETEHGSSLSHITCERTRLIGTAGSQSAEGTGEMETIKAQLALVSIGYKGVAIPGTEEWFDDKRGVLKNSHGLIDESSEDLGGLYVSGWLKRGPSGIIGTNIADAKDTVASILHTLKSSSLEPKEGSKSVYEALKENEGNPVDWNACRRIDEEERDPARKRNENQPREKICSREEQLEIAFES